MTRIFNAVMIRIGRCGVLGKLFSTSSLACIALLSSCPVTNTKSSVYAFCHREEKKVPLSCGL